MDWFSADKEGLSRLMKRRGLAWALYEVVQNGLDQNVTCVNVELRPLAGVAQAWLICEDDDPDGFENLTLAWTLFADTGKRSDPTKAGRFTMGEKMVLALALEAKISTTTGTVIFNKDGRHISKVKRNRGSCIEVRLPMTRVEIEEVQQAAKRIIPRAGVKLTFNSEPIPERTHVASFEWHLQTEFADEDKFIRRTTRKTNVTLFEPLPGETATLYELGLPVVPLDGMPWHVYVHQRVPLNSDRDNVTPAYRKALGVLVLNAMHLEMKPEHAALPVIKEAMESPDVAVEAVNTILTHQYGAKRAIFDLSDPESNSKAFSNGYQVIPGGAFTKATWANIRKAGAALPSGHTFPTKQCYDAAGAPARRIPESEWTDGMRAVATYAQALALKLMGGRAIMVTMENERSQWYAANYGNAHLTFNVPKLGKTWFDLSKNSEKINDLLLHEFGHEYSENHLDAKYHKALTRMGARLAQLALTEPDFFRDHHLCIG